MWTLLLMALILHLVGIPTGYIAWEPERPPMRRTRR